MRNFYLLFHFKNKKKKMFLESIVFFQDCYQIKLNIVGLMNNYKIYTRRWISLPW
jgi:hypothetical protein